MNKGIWITDANGKRRPAVAMVDSKTGRRSGWKFTDKEGGEFRGFTEAEKAAARGKPLPKTTAPPKATTGSAKDK